MQDQILTKVERRPSRPVHREFRVFIDVKLSGYVPPRQVTIFNTPVDEIGVAFDSLIRFWYSPATKPALLENGSSWNRCDRKAISLQ